MYKVKHITEQDYKDLYSYKRMIDILQKTSPLYTEESAFKLIKELEQHDYYFVVLEKENNYFSVFLNDWEAKFIPMEYFQSMPPICLIEMGGLYKDFDFSYNICTTKEQDEKHWSKLGIENSR